MEKSIKSQFIGEKYRVTISLDFDPEEFVIDKMPDSCYSCPCGFSTIPCHSCGRNVPWTIEDRKHRPSTCKLITLEEYLKKHKMF